jgi:predicted AAA+ superfamily ATPase
MYINRFYDSLESELIPNKALILFGPRQVGKTTLINNFLKSCKMSYYFGSGDDVFLRELIESDDLTRLKNFAKDYQLIVIDEAQRIKNIGFGLKLLVDHVEGIRIIVTGSSSFELAGQVGEPLTGRKNTLTLFPISHLELSAHFSDFDLKQRLPDILVYGTYPSVIAADDKNLKIRNLIEITNSYLLKDLFEFDKIKSSAMVINLLRLLAHQVGSEVSLSELAQNVSVDYKTVARYLDLFEKSFIIYRLSAFSRNLRNEIKGKCKYYFYDNGIRNTLISNFNEPSLRNDMGALWENFMVMERLKRNAYRNIYPNLYFWRNYEQKEVDLIEERNGGLFGFEFKWGKKIPRAPKQWLTTYKQATYEVLNSDNYLDFIISEQNPTYCPPK